jgi:methylated-DNA-[protein]-cysteine S-methyltransferase
MFRLVKTEWGFFGIVMSRHGKVAATFLPQPERHLRRMIASHFPAATETATGADVFCEQVRDYFRGTKVSWKVEIDWREVSTFRCRVLEACRRIPFGATASYADLARAAGSPGAARAVGSAMATNPLPLIVPCHRVLRSDGSLGGFSSPQGTSQKERMLKLENPTFGLVATPRSAPRTRIGRPQKDKRQHSRLVPSA